MVPYGGHRKPPLHWARCLARTGDGPQLVRASQSVVDITPASVDTAAAASSIRTNADRGHASRVRLAVDRE